ncbi:MAG: hypothetical protein K9H65_06980 [Bacteroidales bacterium]|nr:hypothetical protein [Bacteroidales bacterium]
MEENQQKFNELRTGLNSNDRKILADTLREVKHSGTSALIPELVRLLRRTNKKEIRDQILEILNNLKTQASANELAQAIRKNKQRNLLSYLVTACWKNGLDYTDFTDDFINIFIQYDYLLALDALTVIENSTKYLSETSLDSKINKLKDHVPEMDDSKKVLARELIHILLNKKENQ